MQLLILPVEGFWFFFLKERITLLCASKASGEGQKGWSQAFVPWAVCRFHICICVCKVLLLEAFLLVLFVVRIWRRGFSPQALSLTFISPFLSSSLPAMWWIKSSTSCQPYEASTTNSTSDSLRCSAPPFLRFRGRKRDMDFTNAFFWSKLRLPLLQGVQSSLENIPGVNPSFTLNFSILNLQYFVKITFHCSVGRCFLFQVSRSWLLTHLPLKIGASKRLAGFLYRLNLLRTRRLLMFR